MLQAMAVDSLENLFRAEYARLIRALSFGDWTIEEVQDAVQDAFLQADRHWSRIRRYDDPAAWVRRVALNRLSNQRRGHRRRLAATARLLALVDPSGPPEPAGTLDLMDAVRRLPTQQRLVIGLHYLLDLDVARVAELLDVAEGTVKSHLHDARRSLARRLEVNDEI